MSFWILGCLYDKDIQVSKTTHDPQIPYRFELQSEYGKNIGFIKFFYSWYTTKFLLYDKDIFSFVLHVHASTNM